MHNFTLSSKLYCKSSFFYNVLPKFTTSFLSCTTSLWWSVCNCFFSCSHVCFNCTSWSYCSFKFSFNSLYFSRFFIWVSLLIFMNSFCFRIVVCSCLTRGSGKGTYAIYSFLDKYPAVSNHKLFYAVYDSISFSKFDIIPFSLFISFPFIVFI